MSEEDKLDLDEIEDDLESRKTVEQGDRKGTPVDVRAQAKKTAKTLQEGRKKVSRTIRKLEVISHVEEVVLQKSREIRLPAPPSFEEIASNEEFCETVQALLDTVETYVRVGEIEVAQANRDLIKIAGRLINLSSKLSTFQNTASHYEHNLEIAKTRLFMAAKKAGAQEGENISDATAKEIGKAYTEREASDKLVHQMTANYLFNIYLSVKKFMDVLDKAADREQRINQTRHQL